MIYRNPSISAIYRRHEMMKKREYGDRVREVELASFTPLVFQPLEICVQRELYFISDWQAFCSISRVGYMVPLFLGFAAFSPFPC